MERAPASSRRGELPRARGHVLVVDDHAALADNLREILTEDDSGIEVTVLGTGKRALSVARKRGFDVAIVDVKLPDASGVDVLSRLKEVSPESEVILITGFATIDAALAALRGGAFALLLKSFRPEELRSVVEQALLKVALRRERDLLERRYRALVEVADVIVLGLDRAGRVALVNPKFTALTGVSHAQATGQALCDRWIVANDRPRFRDAVETVAQTGSPRELEAGLLVGGGEPPAPPRVIRWSLSAEGSAGPDGEGGLVFGVGADVTDRRALERRAANAEALSTMGTLALGLAHEIRNPLNAAVLQMHVLGRQVAREVVDEDKRASMRDRVQIVVAEIKRLGRLLTEFLELARPRGLAREPLALGELIDAVIELHREEASQKGVTIVRGEGYESLPAVLGDREKLRQVFVNLVVNAIEATGAGGSIRIGARAAIERVVVEVSDDGTGIGESELAHVFDPFFTTKPGGTGLGLSIVRKILEQHEGVIHVRSVTGQGQPTGTTVQVELPTAIR